MRSLKSYLAAVAPLALVMAAACDTTPERGSLRIAGPAFSADREHRTFVQRERLGNPLVSEVTVRKAHHHEYNRGTPATDPTEFADDVAAFVTQVAGRKQAVADVLTSVLLPDMLIVFPERDPGTAGWLSWALANGYGGRRLTDDVVDAGLLAIFGPLLDPDNTSPGLTTDNVNGNDRPFRSSFPYLAAAH